VDFFTSKGARMNKKHSILVLVLILMMNLACTISYEGVAIGSDPDIERIEDMTATAEGAYHSPPQAAAVTPEATNQPASLQTPEAPAADEPHSAGPREYSVAATNFDCVCQVDGNVTVEFNFKGDQLEVTNAGGGVNVYDKIDENRYRKSWMGYYILSSGEGENATETKVDEERSVVIILKDDGYVMEHYQGDSASPCCFHTFTNTK
jgi:hypothetical protein